MALAGTPRLVVLVTFWGASPYRERAKSILEEM
jgi:hypothetical protein